MALTRRRFLAAGAAFTCASGRLPAAWSEQPPMPEDASALREPLASLNYDQVKLTGGPLGEQSDHIHAHYLSLSNDCLLKVYRQRAGLPAPGEDMGGWYDRDGFVPGHGLGQYISGLARIGASTGDAACHAKVHELVSGFTQTLGARNESIIRPDTNQWICYTLDKHFAGLIDAQTLSRMPQAAELMNRVLDGAKALLPAKGRDRIGKKDPPYDETFVMPENLFTAGRLTGNPAFQELALRYMLDKELFNPLARGEDPFPGQHAYSHAIALSSAGMAYLNFGDTKYRASMQHAFMLLTTQQQFASGGWGPNETFIHPHRGELYASLASTPDQFETPCGAYAATKLARYLLRTTPAPADTSHGDNLERVLFNTILAVRPPDSNGDYPYYSTYSPDAQKVYYQRKWPCCSGTLVQTVSDYPLNCCFYDRRGALYVNLYTPSDITFTHEGATLGLAQTTRFPAEDTAHFVLTAPHEVDLTLTFRIPAWCAGRASIAVNGKPFARPPAGAWAPVRRHWRQGDTVDVTLPQDFRFEAIDDKNPGVVAVMRGPVQYVALTTEKLAGQPPAPADLHAVAHEVFAAPSPEGLRIFVPLYRVRNESYTSYFSRA